MGTLWGPLPSLITCWRASATHHRVKLTLVVRSLLCEARQHAIKNTVASSESPSPPPPVIPVKKFSTVTSIFGQTSKTLKTLVQIPRAGARRLGEADRGRRVARGQLEPETAVRCSDRGHGHPP